MYGNYNLFKFAELACSLDVQCLGVQDEGCDGMGEFRLCKKGFMNPSSSCIYKKKKAYGMNLFYSHRK